MKVLKFHLVDEALIEVVQQSRLDTLFARNIDKLAVSDHFQGAIA